MCRCEPYLPCSDADSREAPALRQAHCPLPWAPLPPGARANGSTPLASMGGTRWELTPLGRAALLEDSHAEEGARRLVDLSGDGTFRPAGPNPFYTADGRYFADAEDAAREEAFLRQRQQRQADRREQYLASHRGAA
jgi:hypothetical protein